MIRKRSIGRIAAVILTGGWLYIGLQVPIAHASVISGNISTISGSLSANLEPAVPATLKPLSISIPSIKATVPIINVGVTATNNLDVPNNFVQAGWYKGGPVPGQVGTAIIDGHVDNGGVHPTVAGVFKKLDKVKIGDVVNVHLSDGTTASFKVTRRAIYSYKNFPSDLVFGQTSKTLLNIITCNGKWLTASHTYNQRLVVTAEKIS